MHFLLGVLFLLGHMFKSLIHFGLIFVSGMNHGSACIFPVSPAPVIKETIPSHWIFMLSCSAPHILVNCSSWDLSMSCLICFFGQCVYFCVRTMLFLLLCLCSILPNQEVWYSGFVLFSQDFFDYSGSFVVPQKF